MAGTDGPTVQERDFLDSVLSGRPGQGGAAPDTSGQMAAMRNQIAQTMMARPGGGFSGGGDPYAAMRASMASRQPAGGGDPYAAMRASMASRAQPAAGGGGGFGTNPDTGKPYANGWEELARAQAQLDADPNAQYFGSKGPMSGSVTDIGWMNALQPWQGGVTSGGQPGSGVNTSGFIGGGGATRADPAYWGAGGAGAQKSAAEQWQGLQQNNPYAFERLGGVGAASAGIGGGMGPGGTSGVGPGASGGGIGGVGSGGGGSFGGGASSGGGGGGYGTGVGSIGAPGAGVGGFGAGAGSQGGWGGASGGGLGNVGYGGMGGAPAGGGYGAGSIGAPGAGGFGSGFGAGAGGVAGAVGAGAFGGGYGDFGWGGLGDVAGMGDSGDSGLGGMY